MLPAAAVLCSLLGLLATAGCEPESDKTNRVDEPAPGEDSIFVPHINCHECNALQDRTVQELCLSVCDRHRSRTDDQPKRWIDPSHYGGSAGRRSLGMDRICIKTTCSGLNPRHFYKCATLCAQGKMKKRKMSGFEEAAGANLPNAKPNKRWLQDLRKKWTTDKDAAETPGNSKIAKKWATDLGFMKRWATDLGMERKRWLADLRKKKWVTDFNKRWLADLRKRSESNHPVDKKWLQDLKKRTPNHETNKRWLNDI